ncbi:MAG: extracellular solute-binding protein [Lachnospiraceae bacterium]|nr:extracellular solute-binding protein [Lachnospiraceae bacterium]
MKKKVLAVLLAATMVAGAFTGCGDTKKEATDAQTTEGEAAGEEAITATITVWAPQEDQDEANGNWLKTQCEAFAAEHENWDLTFEYGVCSEGDAKTNVGTDATAAADVYMFANDQIPDLLAANGIAELGGSTVEQIKAQNSETMVNTVTYDGGVYGVPFTSNTWFMYYDKSVFSEEDVKNLDTMLEKGTVAFPLSNSWYIASFYVANGCTLFGADGTDEAAGFDFSGDKAAAVTDYLVDLAANPNFKNDADGVGIAGLGDGSVSAIFSGSWDYENVKEALGDNMGIAPAPTFTIDGKDLQMKAFAGSKAIGVNPNAEYPQVAVALAAYLGGTEAQKAHLEARNILPTDSSIDCSGNDLATAVQAVLESASTVQPLLSTMGQYWTPAQTMGEEIVNGSVTHDNAADKTEAMNEAMNSSVVE